MRWQALAHGLVRRLLRVAPVSVSRALGAEAIASLAAAGDPSAGLRELFGVEAHVTFQINQLAIAYDGGVHAKHRLMSYHDFFVERVRPGERVLDIGCGKGELAYDLAVRAGAHVTGIDVDEEYLRFARARFSHPEVTFSFGDALVGLPQEHFDVVVLSNVLEHIAPRVELLRRVLETARPSRVLVRVPAWRRSWTVPLRAELGLPAFSDTTHEIEYEPEVLHEELAAAGLVVSDEVVVWGEIWVEARPLQAP